MEELIYLDAWVLWNARRYPIETEFFSDIREMILPDEDLLNSRLMTMRDMGF